MIESMNFQGTTDSTIEKENDRNGTWSVFCVIFDPAFCNSRGIGGVAIPLDPSPPGRYPLGGSALQI